MLWLLGNMLSQVASGLRYIEAPTDRRLACETGACRVALDGCRFSRAHHESQDRILTDDA